MTLDLDQLLEQAREAKARVGGMQWYSATRFTHERLYNEEANFIAACDPSTIAQLIERVKEAERESADRHRAALEWQRVADDWHDNNAKNLAKLRAAEDVIRTALDLLKHGDPAGALLRLQVYDGAVVSEQAEPMSDDPYIREVKEKLRAEERYQRERLADRLRAAEEVARFKFRCPHCGGELLWDAPEDHIKCLRCNRRWVAEARLRHVLLETIDPYDEAVKE